MKCLSGASYDISNQHMLQTTHTSATQPTQTEELNICEDLEHEKRNSMSIDASKNTASRSVAPHPPPIVASKQKRRGRPKKNNDSDNLLSNIVISSDLIDVPIQMLESDMSKNFPKVRPSGVTDSGNRYADNLEPPKMSAISCAESHENLKGYPTYKKKAINISSGITLRRMSAMANTTPIVTTVTKPVTNPRDANATPRVNIQDFCEEYYEDILPIIMDKVIEGRARSTELAKLTRQAQPSLDQAGQAPGIVLVVEAALTGWTLLMEIVLRIRNASVALESHMITPTPPTGRGLTTDIASTTDAAAQVKRWAMPTWCHMFNSTLIGAARVWFDELPLESIDSYKDLKAAFLAYFMQQKKYVKDPVEIYNIKQKDGETIEDFMERFKVETGHMKGAPECMWISRFLHGVNNLELTKRLNEHVPNTVEEMMITTTAFIRGETTVTSKKKGHTSWRTQDQSKRQTSEKMFDFQGQPREEKGSSRFTPLTMTPKEILATKAGMFQPPPPMVTPVEKRSSNKFCDYHNNKGHSTDECMQLKKQIEELVQAGKLSHLIKEIKDGEDESKVGKKEIPAKDKPTTIYMIQSWKRMKRQKVTQSFERVREITFPSLATSSEAERPLVIEAKIGGHIIHHMYVDRGSSTEIQSVPSTAYGMLKFPADGGIVTIHSTILIPTECATVITSSKEIPKEAGVYHENFKVALHPNFPDQEVAVEGMLSAKGRTELNIGLISGRDIHPFDKRKGARTRSAPRLSKQSHGKKARRQLANVLEEMFLGYMITPEGIKPCPDKTEDLLQLPSPRTIKEVQSLNGKLASLNRFLSKSAEKYFSLFKTLKKCIKKSDFHWTSKAKQAFKQLKQHLSELPLLVAPKPKEELIVYMSASYGAITSNNEAEYEALIAGLRIAAQMGVQNVHVSVDSKMVANQVLRAYVTKEENMIKYLDKEVTTVVEEDGPTWMTPIMEYLKEGTLPSDRKEARKLRIKTRQYELLEGVLYGWSFLTTWLRCVRPLQAEYVIREIHEGSCSMHAGPWSVVAKAIRLGYYWPTMHRDARGMIRTCNDCQIHRPMTRSPQQPLTPITAPWPFYKWGIDIVGPFPEGPSKVKFLIVVMDYFTKWIEAKAVTTITGNQVKKFVWDNIVCRFGLLGEIVSDNGKLFSDNPFKDWCDKLNITQRFDSVKQQQSNGLIERANRSLGKESRPAWARETRIRVRGVTYRLGDFVYHSNDASHAVDGGKLGPKWEGPYEVTKSLGDGAYKLRSMDGTVLPKTWNIANLKKCYL
nr:reverse transcriptase domain-containing protein [Tanacetum cinerariifolium]